MWSKDVNELIPKRWVAGIVGAAIACMVAMGIASALAGCTAVVNTRVNFPMERAAVGLIDTSSAQDVSRIAFYDENLSELGELPLKKGGVGDGWADACVWGDALYIAPRGIDKFEPGPTNEVLEISLRDVAVRPHDMGDELASFDLVAANDRYVFASSWSLNGPVVRCGKRTGDLATFPLSEGSATLLLWSGRSLFVFVTDEDAPADDEAGSAADPARSSMVLQLDESLQVEREYDLSSYGSEVRRAVACDGVLYAVCSGGAAGASGPGAEDSSAGNIVMVNTSTGEVAPYPLPVADALAVAVHEGQLYMVRQNAVAPSGTAMLSVGDLGGGNLKTYELEHLADQMAIRGNRLYLADAGARKVYAYDLTALAPDGEAAPVASTELAPLSDTYTYITNLFPVGK